MKITNFYGNSVTHKLIIGTFIIEYRVKHTFLKQHLDLKVHDDDDYVLVSFKLLYSMQCLFCDIFFFCQHTHKKIKFDD